MKTITIHNMDTSNTAQPHSKPGALNLLLCKCPRCRIGNMFSDGNPWHLKNTMKMHEQCPICRQPFDIEVGFYYGSSYISYLLSVLLTAVTFFLWWLTIGLSINDNRVFYWLIFNAIFLLVIQPYLMRVSRTLWLAFFVKYDRNWSNTDPQPLERVNETHQNNW